MFRSRPFTLFIMKWTWLISQLLKHVSLLFTNYGGFFVFLTLIDFKMYSLEQTTDELKDRCQRLQKGSKRFMWVFPVHLICYGFFIGYTHHFHNAHAISVMSNFTYRLQMLFIDMLFFFFFFSHKLVNYWTWNHECITANFLCVYFIFIKIS